jgi:hypothetical protein
MVYEFIPWLLLVDTKDIVVVAVQGHVVLLDVVEQVVSSEDLGDLD